MALITVENNVDVIISISKDDYLNHNKEYIDETINYFIREDNISGEFEYCLETDTEKNSPIKIVWETVRNKEELIRDLDLMIDEIYKRVNNEENFSKASNISRIVDRFILVKEEINERF